VTAIKSTINGGTHGTQRKGRLNSLKSIVCNFLQLCIILYCESVSVSLFDGLAFAFPKKLESYGSEPKVVLVPSINPKVVGDNILIICNVSSIKTQLHPSQYITKKLTFPHAGRLFLNGTYGTHRYFDSETSLNPMKI
ncbi:hypothetical protein HID58_072860, partial [Brassica napus]